MSGWKKYLKAQAHAYRMQAAAFDARVLAEQAYSETLSGGSKDVRKSTDAQVAHYIEMAAEYYAQAESLEAQACQP